MYHICFCHYDGFKDLITNSFFFNTEVLLQASFIHRSNIKNYDSANFFLDSKIAFKNHLRLTRIHDRFIKDKHKFFILYPTRNGANSLPCEHVGSQLSGCKAALGRVNLGV